MKYKCMEINSSCPWNSNARCLNDSADRCEYSLYINTVFDAIKNSSTRLEMADIIQDYIDEYMCWHNVNECPPTIEEIKEWLKEEVKNEL